MYRELAIKSLKLSLIERGTIYVILFGIASLIYLLIYGNPEIFISMVALSIIMISASSLADKKSIKQFVTTLILSGAKKRPITFCLDMYLLVRVIIISIIYSPLITAFTSVYIAMMVINLVNLVLMSEAMHKVMKR